MIRARLQPLWLAVGLVLASSASGQAGTTAERVEEPVFGHSVMLYRAGPPGANAVVLVHGLGQSGARDWDKLIPALAGRYEVLALDLPGFGQSDKGNELYSPANFARVIEAVAAKRLARPFTLIGHSMGGAVSIAFAARYPERVGRLIVVDAAGILHRAVYAESLSRLAAELALGQSPPDAPWFDSLVRTILTRAEPLPAAGRVVLAVPELRLRLLRGDPNAIAAYALVEHDFSRDLRSIKAPTLVIWGADDKVAPLRTGELAAALIPGGRLAVLERTGHSPMLEQPERFNALVLDELDGRVRLEPYALQRGDVGERIATCERQRSQSFSGDYKAIVLKGCADAQIVNARIGRLTALDSSVRIVNSHLYGGAWASGSRIEVTAGLVGGDPPLVLDATSADAAGTRFESSGVIVENRGPVPVTLSFSVSEAARSADEPPRYLHRVARVAPGKRW